MTYALFLLCFLFLPILLLVIANWHRWRTRHGWACAAVCSLALIYTSPWDNSAAKNHLWTFDPKFAPPSHFVFFLPWEEYAFYFAQGILLCLLMVTLSRSLRPSAGVREL